VSDPAYAEFLANELVPHVVPEHPELDAARKILIGLSLSGLAAAHAALTTSRFHAAVCQSPSFWWENERLAASLPAAKDQAPAFWVSVGDCETTSGVSHAPSGLWQETSQRESCARGSAAFERAGYRVAHREFRGGHDPACWRDDLMLAIPWAMSA
jgi:enterochelin esterase family protein